MLNNALQKAQGEIATKSAEIKHLHGVIADKEEELSELRRSHPTPPAFLPQAPAIDTAAIVSTAAAEAERKVKEAAAAAVEKMMEEVEELKKKQIEDMGSIRQAMQDQLREQMQRMAEQAPSRERPPADDMIDDVSPDGPQTVNVSLYDLQQFVQQASNRHFRNPGPPANMMRSHQAGLMSPSYMQQQLRGHQAPPIRDSAYQSPVQYANPYYDRDQQSAWAQVPPLPFPLVHGDDEMLDYSQTSPGGQFASQVQQQLHHQQQPHHQQLQHQQRQRDRDVDRDRDVLPAQMTYPLSAPQYHGPVQRFQGQR